MIVNIQTPRQIVIGGGARQRLPAVMESLGLARPLIVSDPVMVKIGKVEEVMGLLAGAGVASAVFSDTVPDPTTDVVEAGLQVMAQGDFDCLVALGGGSPIDTAKAMSILNAYGGRMRDYKVPFSADKHGLPVIAIPTTAGTGSECTRFTVITDTETDEKMLIMGLCALPAAAIVDYELTFTVPFRTTADTGIDSLTHAIEAYVSKKANKMSDVFALTAMGRIARHLRTACREPDNAEAREEMMLAATQAGLAFSNASVALVHGMSRPIGGHFHVPHGLSNAMLLPTITQWSIDAAAPRYATCARTMGLAAADSDDATACHALVEGLKALNADLQVPGPKAYGIAEDAYHGLLQTMAEQALASGSPNNNPKVPTAPQIVDLYRAVWAATA